MANGAKTNFVYYFFIFEERALNVSISSIGFLFVLFESIVFFITFSFFLLLYFVLKFLQLNA